MNFTLPPPPLTSLASVAVLTSMWGQSLDNHDFESAEITSKTLDVMSAVIQMNHRIAIADFDRLPPLLKNKLNEMDVRFATEVVYFFKSVNPLSLLANILKTHVCFSMHGCVQHGETFRYALPFIKDQNIRYLLVVHHAMMDQLDAAWDDLPMADVKKYVDLWTTKSRRSFSSFNSGGGIPEIYFMLQKMGKLQEFKTVLSQMAGEDEEPAVCLFKVAVTNGRKELAKYCQSLISSKAVLFPIIYNRLTAKLKSGVLADSPELDNLLFMFQNLLADMSIDDVTSCIVGIDDKLVTRWLLSVRFLPLVMPLLLAMFPTMSQTCFLKILDGFSNREGVENYKFCAERNALLIQMWDETPKKLKTALLTSETATAIIEDLLICFDHNVAMEILRGRSKTVIFNVGLPFCKTRLRHHPNNRTYVYYTFISSIVPEQYRAEFVRRLEGVVPDIDEDDGVE